jgi:hypothetical protein
LIAGAGVAIIDGTDNTLNNAGAIAAIATIPTGALPGSTVTYSSDNGAITVAPGGGGAPVAYSGIGGYAVLGGAAMTRPSTPT